ncbi:MAG: adenosylcobinamide-phosphate synthase CbiB [Synechococcales bacterium]|nr:adenosylcobinamide-phosphate synthase CbiB [Synechococcales bacterium]
MGDRWGGIVLAIAAGLDYVIGDPWNWLHPVQVMGWLIQRLSALALKHLARPLALRLAGMAIALVLIIGSGLTGWLLVWAAHWFHPWMGAAVESVLIASCLAGRSLRNAAETVLSPLATGDLVTARQVMARYVGRDTAELDGPELRRAVMETVTENATDGVMAPLFYAIVGTFLSVGGLPIGGGAIALAYKAASTLDSMIGYREAPYTHLGWFSARLEDGLTWVPCRLTVLTVALLSRRPLMVWRLCCRDAPADPSPNAGWSECAYAAALGVQLGGVNRYKGVIKHKPLLAEPLQPITPERIQAALRLTRLGVLLWVAIALILHLVTQAS